MINKALSIVEAFYLKYILFFLFDNAISHSIYTKNKLQVKNINKRYRKKQFILCNQWFEKEEI